MLQNNDRPTVFTVSEFLSEKQLVGGITPSPLYAQIKINVKDVLDTLCKIVFRFIIQVISALFNFNESLASKCVPLNNKQCLNRPQLVSLIFVKLNHYPFVVSLG